MNERVFNKSCESEVRNLDLLHEGQEAASNGDLGVARNKVEESLIVAKNGDDSQWISYLEGTLAYFSGDLDGLKFCIANAGDNAKVLSGLAQGLEDRGAPNYKEDYGN